METCAVVRRWCCQPCQNCWYSRAFAADQSISRVLCKCCATCLSSPLLLSSTELLSFRFGLLACCLCWCHWLDPDQMPVGSMAEMGTQHHRASQDDKKCDWTWLDQSWIVKCSSSCFKALRVRKTSGVWRYGSCPESVPSPWMKHKPQKTYYICCHKHFCSIVSPYTSPRYEMMFNFLVRGWRWRWAAQIQALTSKQFKTAWQECSFDPNVPSCAWHCVRSTIFAGTMYRILYHFISLYCDLYCEV